MKICNICRIEKDEYKFDKYRNTCKKCRDKRRFHGKRNKLNWNYSAKKEIRILVKAFPELKSVITNLKILKQEIKNHENKFQ